MSAASAATAGDAPKGSKKLIVIIAAVLVLLAVLVGGFFMMKSGGAAEQDEAGEGTAKVAKKHEPRKVDRSSPPTFVPLEPFIVNLADRDAERFAQVGITLQVDDAKMSEEMKAYMPAIRNAVLLILSHKTSEELLSSDGKTKLADEIRREAARAMGYEVEDPDDEEEVADDAAKKKRKKRRRVESYNPIVQVHYANFIIQ